MEKITKETLYRLSYMIIRNQNTKSPTKWLIKIYHRLQNRYSYWI